MKRALTILSSTFDIKFIFFPYMCTSIFSCNVLYEVDISLVWQCTTCLQAKKKSLLFYNLI
jgi:hypothetical protein